MIQIENNTKDKKIPSVCSCSMEGGFKQTCPEDAVL